MKRICSLFALLSAIGILVSAQKPDYSAIDKMLIYGDYEKAADTCSLILSNDSTNADIWYKLGLARQNIMPDTSSFNCFMEAYKFAPENKLYKFTVARGYINKNKDLKAKPLLAELLLADTMNWQYAHYLTTIYIREGRYNQAIQIYNRFHDQDSGNYVILDRLGFANLKRANYQAAIDYYNKSLALNPKNIDAIRNLSFLYPYVDNKDTAIILLTKAISMDPEDIDLYARRATIYFSKNYTRRALNDYLKVLSLGDSSYIYLKRTGIGYLNNLQPKQALPFLIKASIVDSTDFETFDFIAQCYSKMEDYGNSVKYYRKVIKALQEFIPPLGVTHLNMGQDLKSDSLFKDAVFSYSRAYEVLKDPTILMMIANVYDENLKDYQKALSYYRQFISTSEKNAMSSAYMVSVKKRADYLEKKIAEEKAKKEYLNQKAGTKQ